MCIFRLRRSEGNDDRPTVPVIVCAAAPVPVLRKDTVTVQ